MSIDANEQEAVADTSGGEDESRTGREGADGHLHEDQKSRSLRSANAGKAAATVDADSPMETQELAKAGRPDFDPNDGQE